MGFQELFAQAGPKPQSPPHLSLQVAGITEESTSARLCLNFGHTMERPAHPLTGHMAQGPPAQGFAPRPADTETLPPLSLSLSLSISPSLRLPLSFCLVMAPWFWSTSVHFWTAHRAILGRLACKFWPLASFLSLFLSSFLSLSLSLFGVGASSAPAALLAPVLPRSTSVIPALRRLGQRS
jgi:hypothetical protein